MDEKAVVIANREQLPVLAVLADRISNLRSVFFERAGHGAVDVVEIQLVNAQGSRLENEIGLRGQGRQQTRNLIGGDLIKSFAKLRGYSLCPR